MLRLGKLQGAILGLSLVVLICTSGSILRAANRNWAGGSGDFGDPAQWDLGVPGSGDSATFASAGAYEVTFDNSPNPLANVVQNQSLSLTAGEVSFVSGADGAYTYHITGDGENNVTIDDGDLQLGTGSEPLHLMVDDHFAIRGFGQLQVGGGSHVSTHNLSLGAVNSGGTVTLGGAGTQLDVSGTTRIGGTNSTSNLTFENGASGSLSTTGFVYVGPEVGNGSSTLYVTGGSTVSVGSIVANGTSAIILTSGSISHAGASTLTLGGATTSTSSSPAVELDISNSTYSMGAGKTTIHSNAAIEIANTQFQTAGDIEINAAGGVGNAARIVVNSNSSFLQTGNTNITLGAGSGGAALISINSTNSSFSTGTGLFTVNKTGTVDINAGTFSVNGDMLINGGYLDRTSSGTFVLAAGRDLTIQNGGRANFGGASPLTFTGSTITVTGGGSRLENFGPIDSGSQVLVSAAANFTNLGQNNVGSSSYGALSVTGVGTTFSTSQANWGALGGTAAVSFSNGAVGAITGSVTMAQSSNPNTAAYVTIDSGAKLTMNDLSLAISGGSTTTATLTISGANSSLVQTNNGDVIVGHTSTGTATINVLNGGTLTVGTNGATQLYHTGTINIDGGTVDLKSLNLSAGKINFTSGSLSYSGSLTIGAGGVLGTNLVLRPDKLLTMNGTTGINAGSQLVIEDGGRLTTNNVVNHGEVRLGGLLSNLAASSITNNGTLRGSGRVTASVTNSASGDIRVGVGEQLQLLGASFNNAGDIVALGSSSARAEVNVTGSATNAASTGLIVGRDAILQFDAGLANAGSLALNLGTNDVFGDITNTGSIVVTGGSATTFYDDVTQNGTLTVSKVGSNTSVAVFLGDFSGTGGSSGGGDIFFEGDLRPGASPAAVTYGNNIYFGGGTVLGIELGGTTVGAQYDQITVNGALNVDGKLEVSLLDNFAPVAGDSFNILVFSTLVGTFDEVLLPELNGPLAWDTSDLYSTGQLSVVAAPWPGDFNVDGSVDAADYVVWSKFGYTPSQYDDWQHNYGQSSGGSGGNSNVPEPASAALVMFAVLAAITHRPRR